MLPRKLHTEEINRFHDSLESLGNKIKAETNKDKQAEMSLKYFKLTKLWEKIDNFMEFTVKQELDSLDN